MRAAMEVWPRERDVWRAGKREESFNPRFRWAMGLRRGYKELFVLSQSHRLNLGLADFLRSIYNFMPSQINIFGGTN